MNVFILYATNGVDPSETTIIGVFRTAEAAQRTKDDITKRNDEYWLRKNVWSARANELYCQWFSTLPMQIGDCRENQEWCRVHFQLRYERPGSYYYYEPSRTGWIDKIKAMVAPYADRVAVFPEMPEAVEPANGLIFNSYEMGIEEKTVDET